MNVFLTGATGYIGSELAHRLRKAGHDVTALVRASSDHSALSGAGVATVTGDLNDLPNMRDAIRAHDVVIHAAVSNGDTAAMDEQVIQAILTSGSNDTHFIYTSGVWVLGRHSGVATEESPHAPLDIVTWRAEHENRVLDAARGNQTTCVLRPGCVYGGKQGLLREWFSAALRGDPIRVVAGGTNRWAMVHVKDLAALYVQAAEQRVSGILHGTDDSESRLCEIAEQISATAGTGSPIEEVPRSEAEQIVGAAIEGYLADQRVSSRITRERTGWSPARRTFADSIEAQWKEWREALDGHRAA